MIGKILALAGIGLGIGALLSSSRDAAPENSPAPADPKVYPPGTLPCSPDPKKKVTIVRRVGADDTLSGLARAITGDPDRWRDLAARNPDFPPMYLYRMTYTGMPGEDLVYSDHEFTSEDIAALKADGATPALVSVDFPDGSIGLSIVVPEEWFPFYRTTAAGDPITIADASGARYPPC